MKILSRLLSSVLGASLAAVLVALLEARGIRAARAIEEPWQLLLLLLGITIPFATAIGFFGGAYFIFVSPKESITLTRVLARLRSLPTLERSRAAAGLPLAIFLSFVWMTSNVDVASILLSRGDPKVVGAELGAFSLASLVLCVCTGLALLSPLRRFLARSAEKSHRFIDPVTTALVALVLSLLLFGIGLLVGDESGRGPLPLAAYGVLKRSELDLRPVGALVLLGLGALVGQAIYGGRRSIALAGSALALALGVATTARASAVSDPLLVRAVEQAAPFGKIGLTVLRSLSDRDHDGYSSSFGGGDCDDHDKSRSPGALEIAGNGVDEDCSGADAPKIATPEKPAASKVAYEAAKDANLVLVTIDTLRPDLGFMGYGKPVSPNLDRLAARSAVFDRAYSMASYTGKALAPIVIGKYPSETKRNGAHFNGYDKGNVFVAERFHEAGIHTILVGSHMYFQSWSGIAQGFDDVDVSAKAPTEAEQDSVVTSAKVTDAAIRLLEKNGERRFFLWVHYFDPHALYLPHPEAPSFLDPSAKTGRAYSKAQYDAEVWFTDHHVGRLLDYLESRGLTPRTNIVMTSDHGEAFGEHGMSWHGQELWETLVHVPLVVHAVSGPPRRVAEKRSHVDLVPTMIELMGLPVPTDDLSGKSLVPDLVGKPPFEERDVYLDMPVGPNNSMHRALIFGKSPGKKLHHYGGKSYALYDLAADPGEEHDLSSDAALLEEATARLAAFRARLHEIEVKPDAP